MSAETDLAIRRSLVVDAPVERAFEVFTEGFGGWWPVSTHSVGASIVDKPVRTAVFEPCLGGRVYEVMEDGTEAEWAEVTAWEPPARLVYLWHLKRDRAEATEVEIRFESTAPDSTRVDIEHRGWERLGAEGQTWRDRNMGGWATLLPHYQSVVATADREEETV